MSCECYQIGSCIGADPNCPAHGIEAQDRERTADELEQRHQEELRIRDNRISDLETKISELEKMLSWRHRISSM